MTANIFPCANRGRQLGHQRQIGGICIMLEGTQDFVCFAKNLVQVWIIKLLKGDKILFVLQWFQFECYKYLEIIQKSDKIW